VRWFDADAAAKAADVVRREQTGECEYVFELSDDEIKRSVVVISYSGERVDGRDTVRTFYCATSLVLEKAANQSPQRNAGSRPFSGDSSAVESLSSLGPRG
jgi:hypothetical protein